MAGGTRCYRSDRMLKSTHLTMALAGVALAGISLGGCATKGFVRQQVAVTQSQVNAQQATLQADDAHLASLDQGTRDALQRAEAAHKLAEGKFLYSMVLSDNSVKFPVGAVGALARSQDPADGLRPEAEERQPQRLCRDPGPYRQHRLEDRQHASGRGPRRRGAAVHEPAGRGAEPDVDDLLRPGYAGRPER